MMFTFAGTIASWVDEDWNLVDRVIDFHSISESEHEGEHAAKAFIKALAAFGALEKMSCPDCLSTCPLIDVGFT